jgi:hypothetical protein
MVGCDFLMLLLPFPYKDVEEVVRVSLSFIIHLSLLPFSRVLIQFDRAINNGLATRVKSKLHFRYAFSDFPLLMFSGRLFYWVVQGIELFWFRILLSKLFWI